MRLALNICLGIILIFLTACQIPNTPNQLSTTAQTLSPSPAVVINKLNDNIKIKIGQTVYVPIYAHIYYENQQKVFNLTSTLSIRNTDFINSIIITAVNYYDSAGKLMQEYLAQPMQLGPMASTEFVVNRNDIGGGAGANFIVEWAAEKEVSDPVIEAVMIGTQSTQGISFISTGRVIKNHNS
ncbi:hypothetical protein B6N60_04623 [Richelia sinica FACHB-800]|uniref:DUF3124 domain-containing protein n=1 Tax=Richelia sinica FACHB-800 TaxID=1357546 RepID=A0A975Y728_9NOST|nr:DUF3124 domain-containing protein [Richelia sinica]MBD2665141.1 DUF3124 domain-containing protein [Richelia sinica FACHB-800]QXE25903.1 hypothetical protein B6N60_04623 [Richelia sinica FACHB-800]